MRNDSAQTASHEPGEAASPTKDTQSSRRAMVLAERQAGDGEYSAAICSLERAITSGADPYGCMLRIADLYRRLDNRAAAHVAAERAVQLAPGQVDAYELILDMAIETGDHGRAAAASQALIKVAPGHIAAHNALGAAYLQAGQVESAMRVAGVLIRLDPNNALHRFKKGLLCQHMGEIALAVHEFVMAIRLEPDGPFVDAVREALETLDMYQLNQIVTLSFDDAVFRGRLERDPDRAVQERGFALSPVGMRLLYEFCIESLPEMPLPTYTGQYH